MRAERLADVARAAVLRMQLDRLVVVYVVYRASASTNKASDIERAIERTGVEEHVAHGRGLAVDLEGVATQDNAFSDNAIGICVQERAHGNKLRSYFRMLARHS